MWFPQVRPRNYNFRLFILNLTFLDFNFTSLKLFSFLCTWCHYNWSWSRYSSFHFVTTRVFVSSMMMTGSQQWPCPSHSGSAAMDNPFPQITEPIETDEGRHREYVCHNAATSVKTRGFFCFPSLSIRSALFRAGLDFTAFTCIGFCWFVRGRNATIRQFDCFCLTLMSITDFLCVLLTSDHFLYVQFFFKNRKLHVMCPVRR